MERVRKYFMLCVFASLRENIPQQAAPQPPFSSCETARYEAGSNCVKKHLLCSNKLLTLNIASLPTGEAG